MSLSPLELLASTGMLRKALRSGCTLEVGARIVMGKSRDGDVLVAKISLIMKRKKLEDVARTWKMSSLKPVMYTCVTLSCSWCVCSKMCRTVGWSVMYWSGTAKRVEQRS